MDVSNKVNLKVITTLIIICFIAFSIVSVSAATLSASKTMTSSKFGKASRTLVASISCDKTSSSANWKNKKTTESYTTDTNYYVITYSKKWTTTTPNKAYFKWTYQAKKYATNASGSGTVVSNGSQSATFTYSPSKKSLTVQ